MVAKEGAFVNYKIIGVLVLSFVLSAIAVSALTITVDTPSSNTATNSNVWINLTFSNNRLNITNLTVDIFNSSNIKVFTHSNATLLNNSLANISWPAANGSFTDGNFTINVTSIDNATGIAWLNFTTLTGIVLDRTNPNATIQFTDENLLNLTNALNVDYGGELRVNCTPTDATANIDITKSYIAIKYPGISSYSENLSLTENTTAQVRATISTAQSAKLGTFSVKCFVQDNAGNNLETILNFTTQSVILGGTSPFTNEDFVAPIASKVIGKGTIEDYAGKYGALPEDGDARLIKKLGGIKLLVAGEEHEIKVEELEDESVSLLISSEPFTVTIGVNETKEIDVNADGVNDLEIYLHKIHQKAADLVFKEIMTPVLSNNDVMESPVDTVEDVVTAPETEKGLGWIWTLLILIIVILLLMAVVHKISGKGNSDSGNPQVKFTPRDLGTGKNASWGQKPSDNSAKPFY